MRKKLLFVFGLILFLGLGLFLANQVQAKKIASFKGDNLGQIEIAVLREGPKGGSPVLVDDHLRVTGFFYPDQGIVTGNSGGDPVIIGDHMRVDGWLFANAGIVNKGSGGDPVIIADHLRIDGEISRGFGPVKVKDDLEVTGKLSFPKNSITDAVVKNDITASNYLPLSGGTLTGFLLANQAIVRGESGGDPVIIGDHLRVDGEISRPYGPVKVKDDLEVTESLTVKGASNFTGQVTVRTLKVTEKLELASTLDVSKADIVGAEAVSLASYWGKTAGIPVGAGVEQYFLTPWGTAEGGLAPVSDIFCFPVTSDGRIVKMRGWLRQGPGSGKTDTITVRKNKTDTSMKISFSGTGSQQQESTNTFTVSAGDCLSIRYDEHSSGNSVLSGLIITLEIETGVK